jgi:hypothetical protein
MGNDDAYGRVTNAERFAVPHDVACAENADDELPA